MAKRSLRNALDKKLAGRKALNPDMRDLILSFDAEYRKPEKGKPAHREETEHGETKGSQ